MKKIIPCLALFFICGSVMAQSKDSLVAKQIIEQDVKADNNLKKKLKQKQLTDAPITLNMPDSTKNSESVNTSVKKKKDKRCRKTKRS